MRHLQNRGQSNNECQAGEKKVLVRAQALARKRRGAYLRVIRATHKTKQALRVSLTKKQGRYIGLFQIFVGFLFFVRYFEGDKSSKMLGGWSVTLRVQG